MRYSSGKVKIEKEYDNSVFIIVLFGELCSTLFQLKVYIWNHFLHPRWKQSARLHPPQPAVVREANYKRAACRQGRGFPLEIYHVKFR